MSGLVITASGMVTAVGLSSAASCAALRGRLDGFGETRFIGADGEWLIGAAVPLPREWIGEKRLVHLTAGAITDILAGQTLANTGLILCLPEPDRPGRPIVDDTAFLHKLSEMLDLPPHIPTRVIAHGRPSGIVALQRARRLLHQDRIDQVLIVGVDSYLTGRAIRHYLEERRLLTPDNPEGFIPGEAAAAILCKRDGPGLHVAGLGLAREPAPIFNRADEDGYDLPFRADGMTSAYKAAFAEAGCEHNHIGVKMGDLPGETHWFKENALAMLRTQRERSEVQPIWPIAASLGNIGAAVVPVMMGWALAANQKNYVFGKPVLVQSSGDDGACGAVVTIGRAA